MRNVSYKRVIANPTAAVDQITNRAKKQSKIYTLSFIVLGIIVVIYILYLLTITKYDGFMVSRHVSVRHIDDVVVFDYWVAPGDYVKEGDTLYSFVNMDWYNKSISPYANIDIKTNTIEAKARYRRLRSEYTKQNKTLDSLKYVVDRAHDDVKFGVATKEYAEDKEWELFMCKMDVENTARLLAVEKSVVDECVRFERSFTDGVTEMGLYTRRDRSENIAMFGDAFVYRVAYIDMIIINIQARHGVLTMGGEPTITYMPYKNPEMLDLHVKMLLTPRQFSNIEQGESYSAYVGSDFLGKVNTTYSSTFVNDGIGIEEQSKYEYSHDAREILVRTEFVSPDEVPQKYLVDKHPVVLMRYKWDIMNKFMDKLHSMQITARDKETNIEKTENSYE